MKITIRNKDDLYKWLEVTPIEEIKASMIISINRMETIEELAFYLTLMGERLKRRIK